MQTHKKISKKPITGQMLQSTPDEAILATADEPPPYGTAHVVGAILCFIFYFWMLGRVDIWVFYFIVVDNRAYKMLLL